MLQRFALPTPFDQIADPFQLVCRKPSIEVQIQLQARHLKNVRQEKFDLQTGRVQPSFGEELRAALDYFEHRHARSIAVMNINTMMFATT